MQAREKLVSYLQDKLVGPGLGIPHDDDGFERETIEGRMSLAYMQGMLYPRQAVAEEDTGGDEGQEVDDDAGDFADADDPLGMASELLPASMGLTFCLEDEGSAEIAVNAAIYQKLEESDEEAWQRVPLESEKVPVHAGIQPDDVLLFDQRATLSILTRRLNDGNSLVTVSLSNNAEDKHPNPAKTLYQVSLSAVPLTGRIVKYPASSYRPPTEEERELRVIYGQQREFAVGHGVSCNWDVDDFGVCSRVSTASIPTAHVWRPLFDSLKIGEGEGAKHFDDNGLFQVSFLGSDNLEVTDLVKRLRNFVKFYEQWIVSQASIPVEPEFVEDADRIIKRCKKSASRMLDGISILEQDPVALRSFQLANKAMLMSMCHHARAIGKNRDDGLQGPFELGVAETSEIDYEANKKANWRPFQLAFLLLLIPSLSREEHPDRDLVDVIWFATGGGKTEAYLLASAFELVRRRLVHGEAGAGTGIINRYTYRFLTSDQFQRTAGMICALELLRRKLSNEGDQSLGSTEFSIGLFAGGEVSPNRFSTTYGSGGAHQWRLQIEESRTPRADNPFPIESCPCCGTLLVPNKEMRLADGSVDRDYYGFTSTQNSFSINCPDEDCDFHEGLPTYVVDEALFENPPSFLLGTIDKFAMIPWKEEGGRLFGVGKGFEAPSLIIQDELHLISGPLGTLAGIYEAAFETVMREVSPRGPKVIAATATIRNAATQCQRIYGRKGIVFPSPGVNADDSFFSKMDAGNKDRSRLYVGLMGQGLRSTVAVSWVMSAILQGVKELELDGELSVAELDSYWTLVAYHNSKRELGRISNATRDEIPSRLKVYATTEDSERGTSFEVLELKAHSDTPIPVARQQLTKRHTNSQNAVDIVPCTNIISVGVDIDRLGLMLINGQPKLTAEYIQASSRVGRGEIPGIVVTCFSPSKPRDRSHYEAFRGFHEKFYSFVEPTSVTPGSIPAIERALHAALVTVVRHGAGLVRVESASKFDSSSPSVANVIQQLGERLNRAYPGTGDKRVRKRLSDRLEDRVQEWETWCNGGERVRYVAQKGQQQAALLVRFEDKKWAGIGWHTLQSMRHVDTEIDLKV